MSPLLKTMGAVASRLWLDERGLDAVGHAAWYVEIQISAVTPHARFEVNLYPEEWGFVFRLRTQLSSIRVTDVAFVHGADDLRLLGKTPALDQLARWLRALEQEHGVEFDRSQAVVRTNLDEGQTTSVVRFWLTTS